MASQVEVVAAAPAAAGDRAWAHSRNALGIARLLVHEGRSPELVGTACRMALEAACRAASERTGRPFDGDVERSLGRLSAPVDLLAGLEVHPLAHVRFLTDADKETAQQLGAQAEATYAHMSRLLGGEPRELPLLLYGYATNAGYNRFAGSFGDDHASVYGGYVATREASAPAVATIESKDWASLHLRHALAHTEEALPWHVVPMDERGEGRVKMLKILRKALRD